MDFASEMAFRTNIIKAILKNTPITDTAFSIFNQKPIVLTFIGKVLLL